MKGFVTVDGSMCASGIASCMEEDELGGWAEAWGRVGLFLKRSEILEAVNLGFKAVVSIFWKARRVGP